MITARAARRPAGRFGRSHPQDADRHVAAKIRERRVLLGLTQQQLAGLIGVTYQQMHKYETGINRVTAGRLFQMASVLDVEIGYFFENMEGGTSARPTRRQRMMLDLARSFAHLPSRRVQQAIADLVRALADREPAAAPEANELGSSEG